MIGHLFETVFQYTEQPVLAHDFVLKVLLESLDVKKKKDKVIALQAIKTFKLSDGHDNFGQRVVINFDSVLKKLVELVHSQKKPLPFDFLIDFTKTYSAFMQPIHIEVLL